jgi:hypothetical protein
MHVRGEDSFRKYWAVFHKPSCSYYRDIIKQFPRTYVIFDDWNPHEFLMAAGAKWSRRERSEEVGLMIFSRNFVMSALTFAQMALNLIPDRKRCFAFYEQSEVHVNAQYSDETGTQILDTLELQGGDPRRGGSAAKKEDRLAGEGSRLAGKGGFGRRKACSNKKK